MVWPQLLGKETVELKNIGANHRINVVFDRIDGTSADIRELVYITTKVSGGYGAVTGSFTAEKGETARIEWQAKEGYVLSKVVVDGQEASINGSSLSLTNLDKDHVVEIVFEERKPDPTGNDVPVVNTGEKTFGGLYLVAMMIVMAGMILLRFSYSSKAD